MRRLRVHVGTVTLAGFVLVVAAVGPAAAQESFQFQRTSIHDVLEEIGRWSGYRFLYRDALVAGKRISLEARREDVLGALDKVLEPHDLRLQIDSARKQVLVVERRRGGQSTVIGGYVIDDGSGARLPYATITWTEDSVLRGTAADDSGAFTLRIDRAKSVQIKVSYVGYLPATLTIQPGTELDVVPVRLLPEHRFGPEIVVSTAALQTELDTSWHHLLHEGVFSPLGHGGVLRSLQVLPSVSFSTASSSGLNVRGSKADGFQVLLDGMSIYSPSHFFGLFDAFNEDVLQAVGFYYAVAPASLQGPPGGTVAFATRTGSQRALRGSVGLGNTSGRFSAEGPLLGGRGSWLMSGRRSYFGALDWFNSDDIIGLGLDVGRETEAPDGPVQELSDRALTPGDASARFYDAHGKIYYEWDGGTRLLVSGYAGGDEAGHDAVRLVADIANRELDEFAVETTHEWGNSAASAQLHTPIGVGGHLRTTAGFSRYHSAFSKDDFVFSDPTRALVASLDTTDHIIRPFRNRNTLLELKLEQRLDVSTRSGGVLTAGAALYRFDADYREESAIRDLFQGSRSSSQADLFAQYSAERSGLVALDLGMRSHYFSLGEYLRLSPRLRARLLPGRAVSVGAGYSRNYQFIHQLYLEQNASADLWVLSTPQQGPTSVDHVTAGIYVIIAPSFSVQAEVYRKQFWNLREHVASAARRRLRPTSPMFDPWLHDNKSLARGLEVMTRHTLGPLLWSNSYTLSKSEIENPRVNGGRPYPADWDRRHQLTSHVLLSATQHVDLHFVWMFATGAPNTLGGPGEPDRLDRYHRMDAGVRIRGLVGSGVLEIEAGVFNLYDRSNTWYRAPVAVVGRAPDGRRIGLMNVDVFDLGFQPSFEIAFRF